MVVVGVVRGTMKIFLLVSNRAPWPFADKMYKRQTRRINSDNIEFF